MHVPHVTQKLAAIASATVQYVKTHRRPLRAVSAVGIIGMAAIVLGCHLYIQSYAKYILPPGDQRHERVGIVLGAGINTHGRPYKELQARLDVAADYYHKGLVDKLILSGDNRFLDYSEPDAMVTYLMQTRHIPGNDLQVDYAGRNTYASCARAKQIFDVHETVIFSAGSHLPRAIYLCRDMGITAYGVSSSVDGNNSWRREPLASVKAIYNTHLHASAVVGGLPIRF